MRYRALTSTGDYTFGGGAGEFLVNTPACVAQAVKTRLLLATGEWFLDSNEGTPYSTQILGTGTKPLYDAAIQARILGTPGVVTISDYASVLNPTTRVLTVSCTITTQYGTIPFQTVI